VSKYLSCLLHSLSYDVNYWCLLTGIFNTFLVHVSATKLLLYSYSLQVNGMAYLQHFVKFSTNLRCSFSEFKCCIQLPQCICAVL
jgi:hypothetical protein